MIGVISGILPVAILPRLPPEPAVLILVTLSFSVLLASRCMISRYSAGLLMGVALAISHGSALVDRRPIEACEFKLVEVEGRVSSLPRLSEMYDGRIRQRFEFRVESVQPRACVGPQTVLLSYYGDVMIEPGQKWRFLFALKKPWGLANPGSFNMQSWYAQTGIDGVGSVRDTGSVLQPQSSDHRYLHHQLRQALSHRIANLELGANSVAILKALVVADKSGIDSSLWRLFQQYGMNHLLVISGLHVGFVSGLGYSLGAMLGRIALLLGFSRPNAWLPSALALLFAFCYTALSGFSLSTTRALVMLAAFVLAALLGRRSHSWNNLLLAAFAVLVLNPLAVLGSGFWLSFAAVGWLLWLGQWQRSGGVLRRLALTHFCMSLFMVPLGGWWFGGASYVSAMANAVMVPLVGFYVVPLALFGAALQSGLPGLGNNLWWLAAQPFEYLLPLVQAISEEAVFFHLSPSLSAVLLAIMALLLAPVFPTRHIFGLALLLCVPLILPLSRPLEEYLARVTVLDVGQGTSVVIRDKHRAMIYDTGGGDPMGSNMATSVVMPYLHQQGVSSLASLIVSHADNDHSAGTRALLEHYPVGQFLYGGEAPVPGAGQPCEAGSSWQWPSGLVFQMLSPGRPPHDSSNNSSCVLRIQIAGQSVLLPGDVDSNLERTLVRYWGGSLKSDWLLAAHHGSNTSTSLLWLKYVQPAQVVFSAGYGNRFGHPAPLIVNRAREHGTTAYSTSRQGAVQIDFLSSGKTEVKPFRFTHQRYWY